MRSSQGSDFLEKKNAAKASKGRARWPQKNVLFKRHVYIKDGNYMHISKKYA